MIFLTGHGSKGYTHLSLLLEVLCSVSVGVWCWGQLWLPLGTIYLSLPLSAAIGGHEDG